MIDLNKLNCMNYHVCDSSELHWYAQNGLRSLFEYSKITDISFKEICETLNKSGQIIIPDTRTNENDILILTMI